MKHFPTDRRPVHIEGLTHTRAPVSCSRKTALLFAAVLFFLGFFAGAIAFGEVLIRSIPSQEASQ